MYPIWVIKKGNRYLSVKTELYYITDYPVRTKETWKRVFKKVEWVESLSDATTFTGYNHLTEALTHAGGEKMSYYREKERLTSIN